jgi:protein-S-isoprenylcysteine O-methyltransferase Ste14
VVQPTRPAVDAPCPNSTWSWSWSEEGSAVKLLRHLLAIGALPFMVAVIVPVYLIRASDGPNVGWNLAPPLGLLPAIVGCVLLGLGVLLVYQTVSLFATIGKGTLAPWDPPTTLVIRGPYQYVRNPMISGVLAILLGEAIFFGSFPVLSWFLFFFAINALIMPLIEEPLLESRFGSDYVDYKRAVPRWIPKLRRSGRRSNDSP